MKPLQKRGSMFAVNDDEEGIDIESDNVHAVLAFHGHTPIRVIVEQLLVYVCCNVACLMLLIVFVRNLKAFLGTGAPP